MNEQQDDFDLEVSSLQSSAVDNGPEALDHERSSHPRASVGADSPAPSTQRVSLTTRLPRQLRYLRAGSVVALLILLLCAVLLLPAGNRDNVLRLLTPPTPFPTATPLAGDDAFLWEHSVPWGQLLIDGKPGPDVSSSAVRHSAEGGWEGVAFHLPRGLHALEYRATPFPPLKCALTIPPSRSDTCPLDHSDGYAYLTPDAPAIRLLDLQATIDRLPKEQARALAIAAQGALTEVAATLPRGTLVVGDHYVDSAGQVTQALTPLQIEPELQIDASVTALDGALCTTLCTGGLFPVYTASEGWPLQAPVALTWRYSTPGGQVIQDNGPASADGPPPILLLSLMTRWQGGAWQTPTLEADDAAGIDPVICPTGTHALDALRATSGQTTVDQTFQIPFAAPTDELGCVYAGSKFDPITSKSTGPIALVLYRAGALVAVNDEAQHVFPTLSVASPHERALAQAVAPSSL